ncbi:MAG: phage tail protein [Ruminiclostridium sp.]
MSDSVGKIGLDLGINYNQFNKELGGIAGNATNMVGNAFKKLGGIVAAAFAVKSLVDFGKASVEIASNLAEVQNVVDVTFGAMAADINAWSETALRSFGLSELSAKKYSSTIGAMMKSSGLAGIEMEGMSKKITELSADMASFYNLSNDMAFEKIRSGISGETEPLKQLGINMSVANMEAYALAQGIKKSYSEMNQAEQTLLRYNYLLSVTKDAQGDFARTSGSWANQVKLLGEQWKIFQGTMGSAFISILTPVVQMLNTLVAKLQIAAEYFKAFVEFITGTKQQAAATTTATTDMSSAVGDTGKAVKKAGKEVKGALGEFDQLNTLTQATADSAADAAGGISDMGSVGMGDLNLGGNIDIEIDTSKLEPVKAILEEIKNTALSVKDFFVTNFGPPISTAFQQILVPLQGWKNALIDTFNDFKSLGEPLKQWFVGDFTTSIKTAIEVAGGVLSGLLDSGLRVFNGIREAAQPIIEWFVTDGLPMISQFVTEAIKLFQNIFDNVKRIFDVLWDQGIQPGLDLVSTMITDTLDIIKGFWEKWGTQIFDKLKETLDNITNTLLQIWETVLQPLWQKIVDTISWLWEKHLKGLIKEVGDFVGKLVTAALDIYNEFITPLIDFLVKYLGPAWSNIFQTIVDVVGTTVGIIVDVVKGIIKALGGIIDFIAGVFTGDWKRAWGGIKTFFVGIFDSIVGVFKGAINLIIDGLNFLIGALNTVKFDMPDWVPIIGGKKFGISIPKIPKLANGGLVSAPTLAMVGDNRNAQSDPEVVSPLSKLQEMLGGSNAEVVEMLRLILEAIKRLDRAMILMVGETELGKVAIDAINQVQRKAGRTLLEV